MIFGPQRARPRPRHGREAARSLCFVGCYLKRGLAIYKGCPSPRALCLRWENVGLQGSGEVVAVTFLADIRPEPPSKGYEWFVGDSEKARSGFLS